MRHAVQPTTMKECGLCLISAIAGQTDSEAHRPSAHADDVYQIHRANGHDEVLPKTV